MTTYNETCHNSTQISSVSASPAKERQYKLSWYSAIRENPDAYAKFKEYAKQRYEARKIALKELAERGVVKPKAKKDTPYTKPTPEDKRR